MSISTSAIQLEWRQGLSLDIPGPKVDIERQRVATEATWRRVSRHLELRVAHKAGPKYILPSPELPGPAPPVDTLHYTTCANLVRCCRDLVEVQAAAHAA